MARKNEELIKRIEKIGEGAFGVVYIGSYREHNEVGIKDIKGKISDEALTEAKILKNLTHKNIIRYIDIIQTRNLTSIIMEFIDGGSLYDYIERTTQSAAYWKSTRQMITDVAYGMSYLHGERIVHADLKSLNVLLRHNYDAVICDFGLARTIADSRAMTTSSAAGTVAWFAPELCFNPPERNSFASDVWAFGCIILEIISKKDPWADVYDKDRVLINALSKPENANIFEDICLSQRAPEKLRAILCRCCSWQKTARPTFPAIVRDLSTISDGDMQNINVEQAKSLSSNCTDIRPSNSTKRTPKKTPSSSSKANCQNDNDLVVTQTQLNSMSLNSNRKTSASRRTDDSEDQSTNDDSRRYDSVHDRYLYKGPRGGWYYTGSNGKKTYVKNDST